MKPHLTVVIFGAGGQLGVELQRVFRERGSTVHPFERKALDITNAQDMEQCLTRLQPDVVLNAAAYNLVDVAEQEPQTAYAVNALAVRNMATVCRQLDALLVHFSTDYVFDGRAGRPYVETDAPHPLGAYAVSKLAGELYAQAYLDEPLIIRTCGVFGPGGMATARGNFVETMLRLAQRGGPIRVVEDFAASPTYAPALAERAFQLIDLGARGVFHVGGGQPVSWFDYARQIFAAAGITAELVATDERAHRTPARRPKYSALSNAKMEAAGADPMPALATCVDEYLRLTGRR